MNNLKLERTRLGLNQEMAAKKLHVSLSTLSHYETEKRYIPSDFIIRACELYNCNAHYLLGLCDTRTKKF